MVALKTERRLFQIEVTHRSTPIAAPKTTFLDTLELIEKAHIAGKTDVPLNSFGQLYPLISGVCDNSSDPTYDERNSIRLAAIKIDKTRELVTMLFSRGDKDTTDPAFLDSKNGNVRLPKIKPEESVGYSAHMTIGYGKTYQTDKGYRCVLEKMPTVSRTLIFQLLNRLIAKSVYQNSKYVFTRKPKSKNDKPV